jgi:hypothetical protein
MPRGRDSQARKDTRRELAITAAVACHCCGAQPGQPCRAGTAPHDPARGEDRRAVLPRVHADRRAAWTAWTRARDLRPLAHPVAIYPFGKTR